LKDNPLSRQKLIIDKINGKKSIRDKTQGQKNRISRQKIQAQNPYKKINSQKRRIGV